MNRQPQHSLLQNFFSAYFHEDWPCEAESPEAVVAGYVRTAKPSHLRSLSKAIQEYSREFASDRELEENLFKDLGCYYRPSTQGLSAKAWLENVANQLLPKDRS
jgi:hypothetical protein